jgi:uncharacterized protein YacL (UPF0231 family)
MKIQVISYWKREDGWAASTTAAIMAVMAVASTAVGTYSAVAAAQARSAASKFNSKVQQNNATMAEQQSAAEAAKTKERGRRLIGQQRAALSAAGVDIDSGSALDIAYDSNVQNELDRLTQLYKGDVSVTGSLAQSQLYKRDASNAMTAGYLQAGGTLLSGIGQSAGAYGDYQTARNKAPSFGSSTGDWANEAIN